MLNRIVYWSIENRLFVVLAMVALVVAGVFSAIVLPIDAVPDISAKQVMVNTAAPALGPQEIELQITQPLEAVLSGIPGATGMRSISQFGLSQIVVVFEDGVEIYRARQQVTERLAEAAEALPPGVESPMMAPIATGLGEIYYVFVEGGDFSLMERRSILDWQVKPRLRTVPGIIEVNTYGGHVKQYQVLADPEKLRSHGLTLEQVLKALEDNNRNAGGAFIRKEDEQQIVQGIGVVESLDDIGEIVLTSENGVPVLVRDVARIELGAAIRQGTITKDGKGEAVAAIAVMLMGENTRTATMRVKERVAEVQKEMPPGITLVGFMDRTTLVNDTLKTAGTNLFEGGVLVVLILFLFLLQFRAGLIVSSMIPLAMLFAIVGMNYFGVSANLMSLGAIDFGLIVDGGVIIVENIVRRRASQAVSASGQATEDGRRQSIYDATVEVLKPSMFGMAIIMAAYFPVLSLTGVEGKMFRPMALTVIFALVGALILSATLIPALCAYSLRSRHYRENPVVEWLQRKYVSTVQWVINRRVWVVVGAVAFFVGTLFILPLLGSVFIPKLDEGAISVSPGYLPGISVETAIERATLAEKVLLTKFPDEVKTAATRIGRPDVATDPMLLSQHDLFLPLTPRSQWKEARTKAELITKMEAALANIPGMKVSFTQPIEMRMIEMSEGVGVRSEVGVKLFGPDMAVLQQKAVEVAAIMRRVPGGQDVMVEATGGLPVLQIRIRRADIARYGINVSDVNRLLETAIGGTQVGEVVEGAQRYDIVVRFDDRFRKNPATIASLSVEGPNGQRVPLSLLADIESLEGPLQISREDGQRRVVIQANVRGRDLGGFVEEAKGKIEAGVRLPAGYRVEWGGQYEHLQSAQARLAVVVPITFAVIFFLLFIAFDSLKYAALVFTGVPFAVTGGILALYFRGMPFSISAGVGFIALFGVAVLNGVVLVTFVNQLRKSGLPVREAVLEGCHTRLRPVLMTATVASIGFLPMALSTGTGAEVQKPLATVVIGGLVTSTILTLLVLPALYVLVAGRPNRPHPGQADNNESGELPQTLAPVSGQDPSSRTK